MKTASRRRVLALGVGAGMAYVVLAGVSGHLSPLARRPLLDGFAPPPPYRFASPPPNLAPINKPPLSARFTLQVRGGSVSEGLFATRDSQASVLLFGRSLLAPAGQRSLILTLQPMAPPKQAAVPSGESITGNVYRIQAVFEPSGTRVDTLEKSAILTLVYPALGGPHHVRRVLSSKDGSTFTEIPSIDSSVQEQVTAHITSFGYFAVGARAVSSSPTQPSSGTGAGFPLTVVLVLAAVLVAILIGWLRWRERRSARSRRGRRPPPRHRSTGGTRRRR
jgi:hypothetical protein